MARTKRVEVTSFRRDRPKESREERELLGERPLTIALGDGPSYTIMRTPGDDRELAVGFLFSEGLLRGRDDLLSLEECPDEPDVLRVTLAENDSSRAPRNLIVSSSCGLCGRADVEALVAELPPLSGGLTAPLAALYALPARVREAQKLFRATGASHAAALFDSRGQVSVLREDLGRHNALDKLLGHAVLSGISLGERGVFLSGRVSLELVVKAARAGLALLAAVSAPSAAAVAAAERLGITLCGFVRGDEVTVYTHPERVKG